MPRKAIDLPYRVDHLSILDENGRLDRELEPDIPVDLLLKLHRFMLLTRRFDERMLDLQRQGRIGTFAPIKGHEAAHLAAVATLRESDWMVPSFRETGAEIWRGKPLASVLLYFAGYDEGSRVEDHRNDLPISVPVGSQTLHYRVTMHTTADDPRRYRTEEESESWLKRDPIPRFQRYLMDRGLLTQEQIDAAEAEIKAEIQAAVEQAERQVKELGDPLHMFEHFYAEMPPNLREQREELRRELAGEAGLGIREADNTAATVVQLSGPGSSSRERRREVPELAGNGEGANRD